MRIAWVHNFKEHAAHGAGVFVWQLRDELQRQGVEIKNVFVGNMRSPTDVLGARQKIRHAVEGCDLFHVQFGSVCGFIGGLVPGKKILSLRGSDWYTTPWQVSKSEFLHNCVANFLSRRALGQYNHIVTVSHKIAQGVQAMHPNKPLDVIPSGVDFAKFYPQDRMAARAALGCADDTRPWVIFSSVTNSNPLKRLSLAMAAVEHAKKTMPDIVLRYLNNVPHDLVPTHMNAADVVLLTSTHEGWPNIVKEGLACNIPFVSTDVSDLARIAQSTDTCHVAAPTPAALGDALVATLSAPQRQTPLNTLIADMELSNTAKKLIKIYETVCYG